MAAPTQLQCSYVWWRCHPWLECMDRNALSALLTLHATHVRPVVVAHAHITCITLLQIVVQTAREAD